MPLCVSVIESDRWGLGKRFDKCLEYLQRYGSHAQSELPELRKLRRDIAATRNPPADRIKALDEVIDSIESSTSTPTLVSVAQFKSRAAQ
jgi:hypothetical protein